MTPCPRISRENRRWQVVLILSLLPLSWLLMMAVHELGHVLAARLTGGSVTRVVLHPLKLSRTDVFPNPRPLIVIWSGPAVGIGLPLSAWALHVVGRLPGQQLTRFFAGFCLVANGAYLAAGALAGMGDAAELTRHGCAVGWPVLLGSVSVCTGLLCWHRLGPKFGLGRQPCEIEPWQAQLCLGMLLLTIVIEWLVA